MSRRAQAPGYIACCVLVCTARSRRHSNETLHRAAAGPRCEASEAHDAIVLSRLPASQGYEGLRRDPDCAERSRDICAPRRPVCPGCSVTRRESKGDPDSGRCLARIQTSVKVIVIKPGFGDERLTLIDRAPPPTLIGLEVLTGVYPTTRVPVWPAPS